MLHKEIPFLRIVVPLCAGIISGLYTEISPVTIILILVFIAASFIIAVFFNRSEINIIFGIALTSALTLSGYLLYSNEKDSITKLEHEKTKIHCTLSDFPEERENSYRAKASINWIQGNDSVKQVHGSILLYLRKDTSVTSLRPGDMLEIMCVPEEITNRGNPCEFNYKFYMENQGIRYLAYIGRNDIKGIFAPEKRRLKHKALIIREKIIEMYRTRGVTGGNLALVAAMTVGQKKMLEPGQKDNFIKAGVMHIMAVSGLHAVVLSLFVFNVLFFLKGRFNMLRILIALLTLWAFAFVTGLTPSVLRATLMFSFIQAGTLLKRPVNNINSVLASAFVLIIIRPSVIFDAGFLLSYSAVMFIIAFYRELYIKLQLKSRLADKIWQSVVVTLVAQAGTLPLTVMLFNRFPAYFILTNVIIVPLSSLLIITGCLLPVMYPVAFISRFIGTILIYLSELTEFLTEKAASLPGSTIEKIGMTVPECILLTGIISLLCIALINRKYRPVNYLLSFVVIMSIFSSAKDISEKISDELIVYNVPGATVVGIRTGKVLNIYSAEGDIPPEVSRHSSTLGLTIKKIFTDQRNVCVEAGGKKILIADSISSQILSAVLPDIVILSGQKPRIIDCLDLKKFPEIVILSSEAISGFRISYDFVSMFNKPIHNTRKTGAYKMNL